MNSGEELEATRSRGGLANEVCRKVAEEIVLGNFAPSTRLDEASLADRFNVSRTPVREALKQLSIMGLVEYRPNRGSVVATMTPEKLDQMFEAIGELEAACARHAALRMTEADRAQLRELHARGRAAMQAGDMDRYDAANLELHTTIIQGCHNPVLIDIAMNLRHRMSPFRRTQFRNMERMGESFAEHTVIVEAILSHDVITTYRAMRTHLLSARSATTRAAPVWASQAADNKTDK
ncbi:HTH-type transcriptional repressor RspR [Sideroxyarcus emersonii]|uniref:HTH-type transcriptional repressor RspR n=1 Tax=Sideroxyarcus emersonii TaxID=2764705 RepID=A0AAN2BYW4_9PROT|nr:GntR family transcriptional regulator [Sideroxyarcus emersonii]BCK87157.1 HTH-type transcriptional repressor RspR [Sideroxyarcus emersonii]